MRTTVDIDKPILDEIKAMKKEQGKPLGQLVSELLARSLSDLRGAGALSKAAFRWNSDALGSKVDSEDKDVLYATLDKKT